MNKINLWDNICKDWEMLPIASYEFLFRQVKDRYDEVISETVSITEKSIKLTTLLVTVLSGFIAYNYKVRPGVEWIVILAFLFFIDLVCLVVLMFPKGVIFKGSPPREIFNSYLDNKNYSDTEKVTIIYYHEIVRYQERIDTMTKRNNNRQLFYGIALCLTIVLTLITAAVIVSTILKYP